MDRWLELVAIAESISQRHHITFVDFQRHHITVRLSSNLKLCVSYH